MNMILNSQVEDTLGPYGILLEPGVVQKIRSYTALLIKWNRMISLTTVTDPIEILKFHFGESIFAASQVDFVESRLADVGSGAGFPGIPLAMTVPSLDVTLIESNSKKCVFLSEVVRELRLPNVKVLRERMENVDLGPRHFDFIAA
ncbi:MAG: 16S rRNA (guanine(527)-N(7))-methyltransferase RsmG, partial [Candidatus Acidiferrales bacterium]